MYTIARKFWEASRWIWVALIVAFLITVTGNLAVVQTTDLHKIVIVAVLNWFAQFGFVQILLLIAFGLFIVFTIAAFIIMRMGEQPIQVGPAPAPASSSIVHSNAVLFDESHGQDLWYSPMAATIVAGYKRIKELTEELYTVEVLKD